MSWYKDRDFPELKRDLCYEPSEILAIIPDPKQLDRVIEVHNEEILELLRNAEDWKEAYGNETNRLKVEIIQLKQIIEDMQRDMGDGE
jgi:hypothetical protein